MHQESKFLCDVCGKEIEAVEKGYVIWGVNEDEKYCDFKIIHKKTCDLKSTHKVSLPLTDFLGERGLTNLLAFLSIGKIKLNLGQTEYCKVANITEFVDFARRVQTPFYEVARGHFSDSDLLDDYADANEVYPYLPENLQRICKRFE